MPSQERTAAIDGFFSWFYRTYPVNATFIGVHEYDALLPDLSEDGVAEALAGVETLRARFAALPPEPLIGSEALDRHLVEGMLDVFRWELTSPHFHRTNPSLYTGEAVFGVISLFLRPFAPIETRAEAAIKRMMMIPALLAQARGNVRRAPRAWIERAIRESAGADAFFERGIPRLLREEAIRTPRLTEAAAVAASAFREFRAHLEAELRPRATEDYGCGGEGVDLLLRRGHFLTMSANEVLDLAAHRADAAEAEVRVRAADAGAAGWRDALAILADRHPTVEGYYGRYADIWQAARHAADDHRLLTWPDYPLRYIPRPIWAREAAPYLYFLSYRAPAAFDRVPVVDYLVTPLEPDMPAEEQSRRLRAANDSVIKLNHVIHHGGLGHHVQNWHAYRAASRIGQIAAVDCASRIALYCGGTMAEGWACYATELMDEVGFLDPLERVAQAHSRLRIAARAVVDVKLHTGQWKLDEATAYYRDRAGMTTEAAHAETVKNSMFPGVALMYMMGLEQIQALRHRLAAGGGPFDLREFHDTLLSYGSLPVALISDAMVRDAQARRFAG
jgi:uncharacterized protein (DUF885 family)